ncbi:DUF4307 domain-containing protein [Streptomyces sp. NPDC006798]|uniref:DUF4307 domain-containing protein n=1 Tax=Streptomyces sp. NPDC006798 TaxID=3155462 RepID=UPI0033CDB11D
MSGVREQLPEGRYGHSADQRSDRRLKVLGGALGAVLIAVVGWFGYDYIAGQKISAEMIKFDVTSDSEVQVHLEIRKDADATGSCTVRSRSEDGAEVGRLDVRIDQRGESRIDQVYKIRTLSRGTTAELVRCDTA